MVAPAVLVQRHLVTVIAVIVKRRLEVASAELVHRHLVAVAAELGSPDPEATAFVERRQEVGQWESCEGGNYHIIMQ